MSVWRLTPQEEPPSQPEDVKPFEYCPYSRRNNPWCKVLVFNQLFEEKSEFLELCGCQACRVIRSFKTLASLLI